MKQCILGMGSMLSFVVAAGSVENNIAFAAVALIASAALAVKGQLWDVSHK